MFTIGITVRMNKDKHSTLDWIGERLTVAFVTAVFAAITLFLYPLVLSFFVVSHGGNLKGAGIFTAYYQILCSAPGVLLIIGAACLGFFLGADRVATLFSFFWGTHGCWPRINQTLNDWRDEHFSEGKMLALLLAILGIVLWVQFA